MLKRTFFSLIVVGACLGTLCAAGTKNGKTAYRQEVTAAGAPVGKALTGDIETRASACQPVPEATLCGTTGRFTPTSLAVKQDAEPIDRHALVTRHNIECNSLAMTLPLGNGEFCFTADATGLQTFAGNAMSHWGWHSFPGKDDFRPLNLGRLRLCHGDGSAVTKKEITAVKRTLDLWSGIQTVQFEIAGQPVRVETCADPKNDAVAVRIESPLLASGELLVTLDFPYAWTKEEPWLGDWSHPELHTTKLTRHGERVADLRARWMMRPIMSV